MHSTDGLTLRRVYVCRAQSGAAAVQVHLLPRMDTVYPGIGHGPVYESGLRKCYRCRAG